MLEYSILKFEEFNPLSGEKMYRVTCDACWEQFMTVAICFKYICNHTPSKEGISRVEVSIPKYIPKVYLGWEDIYEDLITVRLASKLEYKDYSREEWSDIRTNTIRELVHWLNEHHGNLDQINWGEVMEWMIGLIPTEVENEINERSMME